MRLICRAPCGARGLKHRLTTQLPVTQPEQAPPWRDLPESFGHWHSEYVRYNRWSHNGVWENIFASIMDDPDLEYLMVEGAYRACASARCGKKNNQTNEAQGRSRGGLSTKIRAAVDALGNPVRFLVTLGSSL